MRRIRGIWTRGMTPYQRFVYRAGSFGDEHYLGLISCWGPDLWHLSSIWLHLNGEFETYDEALCAIADAAGVSKKRGETINERE